MCLSITPCIGALVLASFIKDNKFEAITNEVIAKAGFEVFSTGPVMFGSKFLKEFSGEISLFEIVA